MVLWEITLGTAYFLGLRRTYKLVLKAQRKIISINHLKNRGFIYRRTRGMFDMTVNVHKKIQKTDIEAGRNLGNWILRWLDNMKPEAEIRATCSINSSSKTTIGQLISSQKQKLSSNLGKIDLRSPNRDANRNLFSSSRNMLPRSFPAIAMMMRPLKPPGTVFQHRHFSNIAPEASTPYNGRFGNGDVRADIIQWMQN